MEVSSTTNNYVNQASYQAAVSANQDNQANPTNAANAKKTASTIVELGQSTEKATYNRPKGLTSEQTKALQEYQANSQQQMLQSMMQNILQSHNQKYANTAQLNFDDVMVDASAFDLPAIGTTPEEAAAAIAEGGNYSVDAVATRIFSLAQTIANGDSERLATMKSAVEKGFKEAGVTFNSVTKSSLPQICNDTYDEIMKRFANLEKQLAGATETTIME